MDKAHFYEEEIKKDLKRVSKIQIENWRNKALENQDYLDAALRIGLTNEKPYCWRCSWVISKVAMKDKTRVMAFTNQIIDKLELFRFDSQIGGFLKTLSLVDNYEESKMGYLADYCIKIIYDKNRPSYNKYYAIQVLLIIAGKFRELAREFALVIEQNLPYFEKPYLKRFGKTAMLKLNKNDGMVE
ncbi:MAG: hypothetical protein U0W24_20045 [Bacteroidales bacterium]